MKKAFKVLQVRIDEEKMKELEESAKETGVSLSEHVRRILFSEKVESISTEDVEERLEAMKEELDRKYLETIEGECIKYLNRSIESMSIFSFLNLQSFLKKNKKQLKACSDTE